MRRQLREPLFEREHADRELELATICIPNSGSNNGVSGIFSLHVVKMLSSHSSSVFFSSWIFVVGRVLWLFQSCQRRCDGRRCEDSRCDIVKLKM